jgi:phosphatidylserine/phosphatidylglycerophosphate/cardiolipin synthase-like enzyme
MTWLFTPIKLQGNGDVRKVKGQAAGQAVAHGQDLIESNPFAPLRQNNQVQCFTTGKDYFEAVSAAMKVAKKSIFIAGWQVNWDVELTPGERLIDILHGRIHSSEAFRVFVMPWMSPKIGVNTFDLETMLAIFQLNAGRKTMQAMCCPTGPQSDYIGTEGAAFSHHQKMVVIDNEVAYVGGIDLAYGRYDDEKFSLNVHHRHLQERYNPGVPGSEVVKPGHGTFLTMMDLLKTTLTAGIWNTGGNAAPGAVNEFIQSQMYDAKKHALAAVALVNQAAKKKLDATKAGISSSVGAGADGLKASANASADAVVATAHAVSSSCAALQIPDFFGGFKIKNVGVEPTSGVSESVRAFEKDRIKDVNGAIGTVAGLSDFLAPLKHLQISPTTQSVAADALTGAERIGRAGLNTFIDAEAAVLGKAQQVAVTGQQVCVQIGPSVESGVSQGKVALGNGAAAATAVVRNVNAGVNEFQRAVIKEINNVRATINSKFLAIVAMGDKAIEEAISDMGQQDLQAILTALMRLAKSIYTAQVVLSWADAVAHPLLMKKGTKAAPAGGTTLGLTQPRQPWQDVHVEIKGPSVDDVARNFIYRWNAAQKNYLKEADASAKRVFGEGPGVVSSRLSIPAHLMPATQPPQAKVAPTGVAVRVLRSAPLKLCMQEAQARGDKVMPVCEQREIQTQMVNLIRGATDFVYIENQFYQTDFGAPSINVIPRPGQDDLTSGPMKFMKESRMNRIKSELSSAGGAGGRVLLPANEIGKALGDRIALAVRWGQPFHVYMVLPVHPEGRLDDITIVGQIHWTMQSLVFADQSLINRVRRAIAAKKICKNPLLKDAWDQALIEAGKRVGKEAPYELVAEAQWNRYLTLLNLRTCERVNEIVRTEQIYVHSKLLIVDDRHVLLGSANINDRSQSGKRDSELAVMLFDSEKEQKTIGDNIRHVNKLARKLRVDLWKKHFALVGANDIVKAATEMAAFLERPAAAATIKAIQELAARNSEIYVKTFPHVPWSKTDSDDVRTGASIWPVCPKGASAARAATLSELMPFHDDFWRKSKASLDAPKGIKGFVTKLPINWTIDENNHPGNMSVMALTQNESSQQQVILADNLDISSRVHDT